MKRPYQQIMEVENTYARSICRFATFKTSFLTAENAIKNAIDYEKECKEYGRIVKTVKVINKETKEIIWEYNYQ